MGIRSFAGRVFHRLCTFNTQTAIQRAVVQTLEQRRLLHAPSVVASSFDFEYAPSYTTRPHALIFTFSDDVGASVSAEDVRLEAITGSEPAPIITKREWDSSTYTATFTLAGSTGKVLLADGNYRASISKQDVTDADGHELAADAILDFFVLAADANRDRWVNSYDNSVISSNWQQSPRTFSQGDFDYTGTVDVGDLGTLSTNWQKNLQPAPAGPGEVSVNEFVTGSGLVLDWIDGVQGEAGWRVQRSTDGQSFTIIDPDLPENSTSWTDTTVLEGKRYWYRVRAFGNGMDSAYCPKRAATTVLPGPSNPAATAISSSEILLTWTDNATDELGFEIFNSTSGSAGTWQLAGTANRDEESFLDTGLLPQTTYYYYVEAVGEDTNSAPSLAVNATTQQASLAAPSDVQASDITDTTLTLSWQYSDSRADKFRILCVEPDGSIVTLADNILPTARSQPLSGLRDGWEYELIVQAFSNSIPATADSESCFVNTVLPAPTRLKLDPRTETELTLIWANAASHEPSGVGFEIAISSDGQEYSYLHTVQPGGDLSYTASGLDNATGYWLQLSAFRGNIYSVPAVVSAATTLPAPANPDVTMVSPVEANLTWEDTSEGEDGFFVEVMFLPVGSTVASLVAPANATGVPIIGLYPESEFTFVIQSFAYVTTGNGEEVVVSEPVVISEQTPAEDPDDPPPSSAPPAPFYDPGTTLYRWDFHGGLIHGPSTTLENEGNLYFEGDDWASSAVPVSEALQRVHGSINSDATDKGVFPELMVHTYPSDAFPILEQTSNRAVIGYEDLTGRTDADGGEANDHDNNEGRWTLDLTSKVVGVDDPSTAPPPQPGPGEDPPKPYVWIGVEDAEGSESPDEGQSTPGPITFVVGRWGDADSNLPVNLFAAAGTAGAADYQTEVRDADGTVIQAATAGMPSSIIIPHGDDHVSLVVTPVDDAVYEGDESVWPILKADAVYWLTTAFMAGAAIKDSDVDLQIAGVKETEEETIGGTAVINGDNDNRSTVTDFIPDRRDYEITNAAPAEQRNREDDMRKIVFKLPAPGANEQRVVRLTWQEQGRDRINVWLHQNKDQAALDSGKTWTLGTQPQEVWVEGVKEGDDLRKISMTLDLLNGGQVASSDAVKFTVTPVLQKLEANKIGQATPTLQQNPEGNWVLDSKGDEANAIKLVDAAWARSTKGRLQLVQNGHITNDAGGGKGAIFSDGAVGKTLDFALPNAGATLLDSYLGANPFYSRTVNVTAGDTRSREDKDHPNFGVDPIVRPQGITTTMNVGFQFALYAVWSFLDGTIYLVGKTQWHVQFDGSIALDQQNAPRFTAAAGNGVFGSDGPFQRGNQFPEIVLGRPFFNAAGGAWR